MAAAGQEQRRIHELLATAVSALGGSRRPGQEDMAAAVAAAMTSGEHLLVQAGTGTGKSLAYLVPAIAHAMDSGEPVVVSTATLALQAQVVERDLPRIADALEPVLGRRPTWQMVKGRRNYVCRHKLGGGFPAEDDALFSLPAEAAPGGGVAPPAATSRLGRDMRRLQAWAEKTESGDRDELVPGVGDRAWRQVSVSAHECLGSQRCPTAALCHSDRARVRARSVDIVVSNHAFVAIDSFEGRQMLPDHDVLVIDEAHELADRVTSVISDEISPGTVEAAARRAQRAAVDDAAALEEAAGALRAAMEALPEGRLKSGLPEALQAAVEAVRSAARAVVSALGQDRADAAPDGARQLARAAASEVHEICDRLAGGAGSPGGHDVVWLSRRGEAAADPGWLHRAPLSVAELLRERVFRERTVVLTSATLAIGGGFDPAAEAMGLAGEDAPAWRGMDVGSPFDYPKQGILYLARHLPAPTRTGGPHERVIEEIELLMRAAGGRTLGLFSSRRAAEVAATAIRERVDVQVLCQGDDVTPTLVREFAADPRICLFGTLSLWQGVDVPGVACHLVIIDRIPFPRPDDPLASARQEAASAAGGNGFMAIAATHAALRLAQGAGRLIRTATDRGVVAVLDSRLATARYGEFLRASLPPLWPTTDRDAVLAALRRLDESAAPVLVPSNRVSSNPVPSNPVPSKES